MTVENNQTRAYQLIRDMIMRAELKPGQKISKNQIVKHIDIGDTPVREAILRLQKEGLLDVIPQSGTYVSKINLKEVAQARFVRENIEKIIMVEASTNLSKKIFQELDQMIAIQQIFFDAKDTDRYFQLDEEFHQYFYQIADKEYVWQWLQILNVALNRYRYLRLEVEDLSWDNILDEHKNLVHLLKNQNIPELQKAIAKHIHMVNNDSISVVKAFPDYFVETIDSE